MKKWLNALRKYMRNMEISCILEIDCGTPKKAEIINEALRVDNEGYMESKAEGSVIKARTNSENFLSLLHTLNDFLSCLLLAEESIEGINEINR